MGKGEESFLEAGKDELAEAVRPMTFSDRINLNASKTNIVKVEEREDTQADVIFGISGRDQEEGSALSPQADEPDERESVQGEGQEETEEQQQPKVPKIPKGPTKKERQEHEALHIHYRSWCRHCVRGRARNKYHMRDSVGETEEKEHETARISMDYFFMSEEDRKASENPLLVMIDEKQGY